MNGLKFAVVFLLLPILIYAQNYPKRELIDEDVSRKFQLSRKSITERYKTPGQFTDSTDLITQQEDFDSLLSEELAEESEEIQPFGYNLFARGGTTLEIPQNLPVPEGYKLGSGDNIMVNLWGRVEQQYDLTIDRQGVVFIPRVGEVSLWGLTVKQAEARIKTKLQEVFSDFKLSLTIGKLKSIQVFVFGEVRFPGSYGVSSLSTLFSILYLAGGPTETGSLRNIRLIRSGVKTTTIDLYQFLLFGKNDIEVSLQSGDIVFVDVVGKRIKVDGEVKRPAIFEVIGQETILDVIQMAGGTLPTAYCEKVQMRRIASNDAYKIIDLNLGSQSNDDCDLVVEDGDEVYIESIYDFTDNVIYLEGEFRHPGLYQYCQDMKISDLFKRGCDLTREAYKKRIDILREDENLQITLISINPQLIKSGKDDLTLKAGDRLIAYSREEVVPEQIVSIFGLVTNPGEYPLYGGMKVSDLIFQAGNLRENAYRLRAEIARTSNDGGKEVIYAWFEDTDEDTDRDVLLKPSDKVFVREIPGWKDEDIVTIKGEVRFPGKYVITSKMNTLYSLIERTGGLTLDAFIEGTVFTRASIIKDLKRRGVGELINRSAEKRYDSTGAVRTDSSSMFDDESMSNRIVVNVTEMLKSPDNSHNVELAGGDQIYIPRRPTGIQVLGAVPSISTIAYRPKKKANYYIKSAGGCLRNADKDRIQLIRANGAIVTGRTAKSKKIELGDAIFVPTRIQKDRDWSRIIASTVSITASLITTVYIVDRL